VLSDDLVRPGTSDEPGTVVPGEDRSLAVQQNDGVVLDPRDQQLEPFVGLGAETDRVEEYASRAPRPALRVMR